MKITIKLFAGLRQYLPVNSGSEGMSLTVPQSETPHQVLGRFKVPLRQVHLVLVNGVYIEPDKRDLAILQDGDVLAVWPPVAGG